MLPEQDFHIGLVIDDKNEQGHVRPPSSPVIAPLRGNTILESPIIQAADPQQNYARVLAVFRVPGTGQTQFKAQFIGCFAPDGTSINDNLNSYHQNRVPLH